MEQKKTLKNEQEKLKTAKILEALAQGIGFDKDGKPVFAGKRITTTAQILPADIQIDEIYVQNRQGTQPAVKPVYDKAIDTVVQEAVSDFDKKHLNINLLESYLDQRKEVVEKFAEFHEKQKQVMQVFDEKKQIAQDLGFKYVFGKQHGDLLSEDFLSCLYDSESYQSEKLESKICDDSNLSFEYQLDEIAKTIQYKIRTLFSDFVNFELPTSS